MNLAAAAAVHAGWIGERDRSGEDEKHHERLHENSMTLQSPAMLSFDDAQHVASRLRDEMGRAIIGQQTVVHEILIAFFAGGHCLLRGVPGLAKTLLIKTLAQADPSASSTASSSRRT